VPDDGYANENRNTFEELFFGPAGLNATAIPTRHDFVFAAPHF
jgi:hypothetical protein